MIRQVVAVCMLLISSSEHQSTFERPFINAQVRHAKVPPQPPPLYVGILRTRVLHTLWTTLQPAPSRSNDLIRLAQMDTNAAIPRAQDIQGAIRIQKFRAIDQASNVIKYHMTLLTPGSSAGRHVSGVPVTLFVASGLRKRQGKATEIYERLLITNIFLSCRNNVINTTQTVSALKNPANDWSSRSWYTN